MDKVTEALIECQFHQMCDGYCETPREVEKGFCEKCLEVNDQHWCQASGKPLHFGYVNYRGEFSKRRATPIKFEFGESEYHTSPQWLMSAIDHDKGEIRQFALSDMVLDGRGLDDDALNAMFKYWIENEFVPNPPYSTINMRTERCKAFIAGAKAAPYLALGEQSRKLRAMTMIETGYRVELQARLTEVVQIMREHRLGTSTEAHDALLARCESALVSLPELKS